MTDFNDVERELARSTWPVLSICGSLVALSIIMIAVGPPIGYAIAFVAAPTMTVTAWRILGK